MAADTVCSSCGAAKDKSDYSKAQLKKKAARKCKTCVEGGSPPPVSTENQAPAPPPVEVAAGSEEKKTEDEQPPKNTNAADNTQKEVVQLKKVTPPAPKEAEPKPQEEAKSEPAPVPTPEPQIEPEKKPEMSKEEQEKAAKAAAIEKEAQARLAAQRKPISFASAFGGDEKRSRPPPPITTPKSAPSPSDRKSPTEVDAEMVQKGRKSGTAFGAAKNKRNSGLMTAYLDKVAHEPLPGDSVPISPSPRNNKQEFSPTSSPSPSYLKLKEMQTVSLPSLDVPKTPKEESPQEKEKRRASMQAIRQKFDETAKRSDKNFEFGESFRQKQRNSILTDKQKKKEAEVSIKGFDAMVLSGGKTATGEVDTSNLMKTFVFETSTDNFRLADGVCRVDYKNNQYEGYVFLVHRTRGLILLQHMVPDGAVAKSHVPGGSILENEFLRAAEKSGHEKIQLQIAAREAAARQLYEKTGINVRKSLERMKPAVLRLHAPDTKDGKMMLKNEQGNRLYYFLQVTDEDFVKDGGDGGLSTPAGESDSALKLKLSPEYTSYTFAKEPMEAAKRLKENGDGESTDALNMVMNQAAAASTPKADIDSNVDSTSIEPEKAKVFFDAQTEGKQDSVKADEKDGQGKKAAESAASSSNNTPSKVTQTQKSNSEPVDTSCACNCNIM